MRVLLSILLLSGLVCASLAQSAPNGFDFAMPMMSDASSEDAKQNRSVVIERHVAPEAAPTEVLPRSWRPQSTTLNWIDYSILAATGVAAAVAIHYKFEADELYDDYQQTGDPALRSEIRALDRRSLIALGGMQAGVTVFAVRLLLR